MHHYLNFAEHPRVCLHLLWQLSAEMPQISAAPPPQVSLSPYDETLSIFFGTLWFPSCSAGRNSPSLCNVSICRDNTKAPDCQWSDFSKFSDLSQRCGGGERGARINHKMHSVISQHARFYTLFKLALCYLCLLHAIMTLCWILLCETWHVTLAHIVWNIAWHMGAPQVIWSGQPVNTWHCVCWPDYWLARWEIFESDELWSILENQET